MVSHLDARPAVREDECVPDGALYFPFIDVPNSPALARVLLYWDDLATIVPVSVGGSRFRPHTRELVDLHLVRPLDPEEYAMDVFGSGEDFIRLVDGLPPLVEQLAPVVIHGDKATSDVWNELEQRQLAGWIRDDPGWLNVDARVGALFMAHLAARLGRLPAVNLEPITDQRHYFRALAPRGGEVDTAQLFDQMRGVALRDALPAPADRRRLPELAAFKQDHWELLGRFRRWVEGRLLECAREPNAELRRRMVSQLHDEMTDEVDEISARLRERRFTPVAGVLCTAIAASPAVAETALTGNPFPVAGAVALPLADRLRKALTGGHELAPDTPLAYAALAQHAFA
jgi:hypothetical protein